MKINIILHFIQKPNPVINVWPKQLSYQPSAVLNSVDICTTDINYTDISNCLLKIWSAVAAYKELGKKPEPVRNAEMF